MFLYVMDSESRDKLTHLGYTLLKYNNSDDYPVWIFEYSPNENFSLEQPIDIPCVVSDTLTF